ncbi:MAG: Membrane-bound lytic murein transglycosylase F [Oscillospiraceae bacterium]|jgi:hypothetical protein
MKITPVNSAQYHPVSAEQTDAVQSGFSALLESKVKSSGQGLDDIFKRASQAYNVPENLLKAVAKTESGFRADAVSRCGAQGIMQLMPSTAQSLGVTDAFDPEQNIMGGAKYLSSLLDRYGNVKLALAAYNAGSGNVEKYGGIPPFEETQKYVEKVLTYAGGDVSVPAAAGDSGIVSGGLDSLDFISFTMEDYRKFIELFIQQLLESTLSHPDEEKEQNAEQNIFLM